jgi:hypothetical protein
VQLVKGWREILLLHRGVVIRRLYSDGTWQSELTKETLRVLYLPPECNESVAVLDGAIVQHSVLSASKSDSDPTLRMMFAGRAAGTNANILFDSGASDNFVSISFAHQTGISVIPAQRKVRLGSDDVVTPEGEANVYLKVGTYQQSVRCVVMPLLHEVDVILGQKFMSAHKCILDFERSVVLMKKGTRRVTVARAPVHGRVNPDSSANPLAVLSASQLRRAYKKGHRVYLAVIKPIDDSVDNPADNTVKDYSAGSLDLHPPIWQQTSLILMVRKGGYLGWLRNFLMCSRILCLLAYLQKGMRVIRSPLNLDILLPSGQCTVCHH